MTSQPALVRETWAQMLARKSFRLVPTKTDENLFFNGLVGEYKVVTLVESRIYGTI